MKLSSRETVQGRAFIAVTAFLLACSVYVTASRITFSKKTFNTPPVMAHLGLSYPPFVCKTVQTLYF